MERNHDSGAIKVLTPLGMIKFTQRVKTHQQTLEAAPDFTGGHLNNNGNTFITPSKGVMDDNLPINNLEAESPSPGISGGRGGRLIKDDNTDVTIPTSPHDQYQKPKYQKYFSKKIKF
jgi:hypothetical protein